MKIYPVPEIFRVPDRFRYPEDNWPDFEYWFMVNFKPEEIAGDRVYLPILFTSYFKTHGYGLTQKDVQPLQNFVDTLPGDLKYFCVVQYDNGTLVDWKGKDVVVFAMSGKPENCIPIPLVCQPHKYQPKEYKKDILLSFVGRITHPIRQTIVDWGAGKDDCYFSSRSHSLTEYCEILVRSRFVISARGYGATSFRVCEAMQYGAIPIIFKHIDDRIHMCPFSIICDFVDLKKEDLDYIYNFVKTDPPSIVGQWDAYQRYYTFEGVKKTILQGLWDLQ
jgi:hypothetical protein